MASKTVTRRRASRRKVFNATYGVITIPPSCGPRTCSPLLTLCGKASADCMGLSVVQLVVPRSREAREILELVQQIRKLQPRLGIEIKGKPGDIRRIVSGLKRL